MKAELVLNQQNTTLIKEKQTINDEIQKNEKKKQEYQQLQQVLTNDAKINADNSLYSIYTSYTQQVDKMPEFKEEKRAQINTEIEQALTGINTAISNLKLQLAHTGDTVQKTSNLNNRLHWLKRRRISKC